MGVSRFPLPALALVGYGFSYETQQLRILTPSQWQRQWQLDLAHRVFVQAVLPVSVDWIEVRIPRLRQWQWQWQLDLDVAYIIGVFVGFRPSVGWLGLGPGAYGL